MTQIIIVIIYFLLGYWVFKTGVEQYGGKEKYLSDMSGEHAEAKFIAACLYVIALWPVLMIASIIRRKLDK